MNKSSESFHIVTPLLESDVLSNAVSDGTNKTKVYLKLDNDQPSGSFKIRGIGHYISKMKEKNFKDIVISSGGNAGIAATYAAGKLNLPIQVVVPETTKEQTRKKLESMGAKVIVHGEAWDDADVEARRILASSPTTCYVHPFDHELVWEGHATIIDEIKEQLNGVKPDCIIAAVGGGGLFIGVIEGLKRNNWLTNDIDIIAAETVGADCFNLSVAAGKVITLDKIRSIATCLGAKTCAQKLFDLYETHKNNIISIAVTDKEAVDASLRFLDDHRILSEFSCGATLAVVYNMKEKLPKKHYKNIVAIVCGGNGINLNQLLQNKEKFQL